MQRAVNLASFSIFLFAFVPITGFDVVKPSHQLIGIWEAEEKNLQIEMFEDNGQFAGE